MEFILKEKGTILGLREAGKKYRQMLEECINSQQQVTIDFEGVESVSSSFADEFIARLYLQLGKEKFTDFVKMKNANDFVKVIINSSIKQRIENP